MAEEKNEALEANVEPVETEAEPTEVQPPAPEYLTKEEFETRLNEGIKEASGRIQSGYERWRKEFKQKVDAAEKRALQAEQKADYLARQQLLDSLDPEQRAKAEAFLRPPEQAAPQQFSRAQAREILLTRSAKVRDMVESSGVDPDDDRIDWGEDALTADDAVYRVEKSLAALKPPEKEAKVETKAVKENLETPKAPPVETTGARAGARRKWTKAEIDALPLEEYREHREEIDKAHAEGLITE